MNDIAVTALFAALGVVASVPLIAAGIERHTRRRRA